MNKPQIIIEPIYNEEKNQFEVYMINPENGLKSCVLTQTHEEILDHLRNMIISQFNQIAQTGLGLIPPTKE